MAMFPYLVEKIRYLSQEEGLTDQEIANIIGCSRATVNRARQKYGIPRANRANRKDKSYVCQACQKVVWIRRKERRKRYCDECRGES